MTSRRRLEEKYCMKNLVEGGERVIARGDRKVEEG